MAKKIAKKKATAKKTSYSDIEKAIIALDTRVRQLEAGKAGIVKAFRKGANEIRPLFGLGNIAVMLDKIAAEIER